MCLSLYFAAEELHVDTLGGGGLGWDATASARLAVGAKSDDSGGVLPLSRLDVSHHEDLWKIWKVWAAQHHGSPRLLFPEAPRTTVD